MLLERGIDVSYETMRRWTARFGPQIARNLPFRKRERAMQGYRSLGALQRFVAVHSTTRNCFSVPARRRSALTIRYHRMEAFDAWRAAASIA